MSPMVPSWVWDLFVLVAILAPLAVGALWACWEAWRDRRRRRDQETDRLLRAGMRSAWRRGWLQDGDQ